MRVVGLDYIMILFLGKYLEYLFLLFTLFPLDRILVILYILPLFLARQIAIP
jgi:hypothetical protein